LRSTGRSFAIGKGEKRQVSHEVSSSCSWEIGAAGIHAHRAAGRDLDDLDPGGDGDGSVQELDHQDEGSDAQARPLPDAIDQYYADKGKYPASLDALVSDGYIRSVPEDPITLSNSTWQTVPAEPDPGNPSAESGVYDVKSGAPGTSLDGSSYSEW
jgi:hypothetical protein